MSTLASPVATIPQLDPSPSVALYLNDEELELLIDLLDEMQLVASCTAAFSAIAMPGSRRRKAFVTLQDKVEWAQSYVTDHEEEDDDDTV